MNAPRPPELIAAVRNRWFTGKMLDAFHMELETDYGIRKRWLLNRLVLGSGVVQGLDVKPTQSPGSVTVTHGLAIDWEGREIIVPTHADQKVWTVPDAVYQEAKKIQQAPGYGGDKTAKGKVVVRVVLCYKDDQDAFLPADFGSGCGCDPGAGTIKERYEVCFDPHPAKPVYCQCRIPNLYDDAKAVHATLANWVTKHEPTGHPSPCITLANLTLDATDKEGDCGSHPVDITVRPIVYSNDLLFEMILGLLESAEDSGDNK